MIPLIVLDIVKAVIPAVVNKAQVAERVSEKIARQPDPVAIPNVVVQSLPAPKAMEPLWPQLARYAISIAGTLLASQGYADANDVNIIGGALMTIGPPLYRVITTLIARRKAA